LADRRSSAENWGLQQILHPEVEARNLKARLVTVPAAQSRPTQAQAVDVVFVGINGELEFKVGTGTHLLERYDIVTIAAGTPYEYRNVGFDDALMFEATGPGDGHNKQARLAATPPGSCVYWKWEEYRRGFHWQLPLANTPGNHRGSGPHVTTRTLLGHLVRQLPGQSCPWHAPARDLIFLQLRGEVVFTAAGAEWPLKPFDVFMMPEDTPYIYSNPGSQEMLFFDIGGPRPSGKDNVYYAGDPGWPPAPDAPRLELQFSPTGEARLRI
jgi:mannose-6-phosphate isomerase-like protein (cupin superfamily)